MCMHCIDEAIRVLRCSEHKVFSFVTRVGIVEKNVTYYIVSHHVMSFCIMLFRFTSCYVVSHHVMSCYTVQHWPDAPRYQGVWFIHTVPLESH